MSAAHNDDRWEAVLNGWLQPEDMDDRALAAKYPKLVRRMMRENALDPGMRRLYDELARELYDRTDEKLRAALLDSVDTIIDLSLDLAVDPAVRLRAATYLLERVRGKTPDVVEIRQDKPFQVAIERIVTGPRPVRAERLGLPDPTEPLEAEIVEEADPEHLREEAEFMRNWEK